MSLFLGEGVAFCKFVKHNISHTSPRRLKENWRVSQNVEIFLLKPSLSVYNYTGHIHWKDKIDSWKLLSSGFQTNTFHLGNIRNDKVLAHSPRRSTGDKSGLCNWIICLFVSLCVCLFWANFLIFFCIIRRLRFAW